MVYANMKVYTKKKPRTMHSPYQVCFLEERFEEQDFPNKKQREDIAKKTEMTEHHVQIWFQNKRAKRRRKEKRRAQFELKVTTPKAPYFWPHNLSFDSALQEVQPNSIISSCYSSTVSTPIAVPSNGHCNNHSTCKIENANTAPLSVLPNDHGRHTLPNNVCSQIGNKHLQGSELGQDGVQSHTLNNSFTESDQEWMSSNELDRVESKPDRRSNLEVDIPSDISMSQSSREIREPGCYEKSNQQFLPAQAKRDAEHQAKTSPDNSPRNLSLHSKCHVTNGIKPNGGLQTPDFEQCPFTDEFHDTTIAQPPTIPATQCQAVQTSIKNREDAGAVSMTDPLINPLLLLADCATARI